MTSATATSAPILAATGLEKRYGAIEALRGIDISVWPGEIVAIVGDNGAGKTTLIKVMAGVITPDSGTLTVDGQPNRVWSVQTAERHGIETVYQDLALAPNLDVAGNVFLGREPLLPGIGGLLRVMDRRRMIRTARAGLDELEVTLPRISGLPVARMSGGQRQAVAIARSAMWASRVLLMDEPTAALGVREAEAVLRLIRRIRDRGIAVVMISHVLPHVTQLADRIIVMRHGEKVADLSSADGVSTDRLIALIVGVDARAAAPDPTT